MKISSLSIVIPCYNTHSTVSHVISNAYETGRRVSKTLEILVLDDASTDETPQIIRSLKKKIPSLRVLTHTTNKGYGETIRTLYMNASYEWIFSLPSDDQFNADELEKLLPFTKDTDMILGLRKERNDSAKRKIQSFIYNSLLRIFFGLSLKDANSIRLMKKSLIDKIPLTSHTAFVDAELAIMANRLGMTIREIPVAHKIRKDKGGSGGKFFKTILPTIIDMIRMKLVSSS